MQLGTRLKKVKGADAERFRVTLEYEDGFTGQVDLSPIFGNPAGKPQIAEILRGHLFGDCFVESGALAWPNGYQLCPDALRRWVEEQRGRSVA